jgi:hypothetical protein
VRGYFYALAVLGSFALLVGGGVTALGGFPDLSTERDAYRADFRQPGDDDCGGMLTISVENGERMYCYPVGVQPMPGQNLENDAMKGFSAAPATKPPSAMF